MDVGTLLRQRYGSNDRNGDSTVPVAEATIFETILAHRSVRHYRLDSLPPGSLERLVAAAQSASSSSNLQTWSVVAVEDAVRKERAAVLCGDQDFIRQAPLFLVFCGDLSRLTFVSKQADLPGEGLDYLEMFLMAAIDASLAAQNAALAAEAEGLGICYVGAARNRPRELAAFLGLPPRVFALFGMAVGWPAAAPAAAIKPRLSQHEVLHRESYGDGERGERIADYDRTMAAFYDEQGMQAPGSWSHHSARRVATVESLRGRHTLREFLQKDGFGLK